MNIGIDIDGVLTDIENYELENGKNFFGYAAPRPEGYEVEDKFNVPLSWSNAFWTEHIIDYATNYPARKDAALIINKLHEEGYKIILITARHYQDHFKNLMKQEEMPSVVEKWLKDNNIYYDKLFFTGNSKVDTVKKCKLTCMVEDSPKNIRELSKLIPIIVFDAKCNENIEGNNIVHTQSWKNVYNIIVQKKF